MSLLLPAPALARLGNVTLSQRGIEDRGQVRCNNGTLEPAFKGYQPGSTDSLLPGRRHRAESLRQETNQRFGLSFGFSFSLSLGLTLGEPLLPPGFKLCRKHGLHLQQVTGPRQPHPTPRECLANQLGEQPLQPLVSLVLPEPADHFIQQFFEPLGRMPLLETKQQRHQTAAPRQLVLGKAPMSNK